MIEIFSIVEKPLYALLGQYDPENRLFLHFDWRGDTFSHTAYKQLLSDWDVILDSFAHLGITEVFSAVDHKRLKAQKLQAMFGLEYIAENDNAIYYRLEV